MNIQERRNKDGKITSFRIRVFDHRDVTTGKQVFKTLSVKYDSAKSENWNRKNAEKEGAVFEKSVQEFTATDSCVTFDKYTEYVLKIKAQSGLAKSTIHNYGYSKRRLAPFIGHIQLKSLSPNALNRAYTEMVEADVPSKYVHELHVFVHMVLGMAFKEGIIPRNYASAATPPKGGREPVTAISEKVLAAFLNALYAGTDNYVYQVFFSLMLATGCRIGELCALPWNNVDWDEGRIHINQHFVHDETGRHIEKGCKTTAGERWLYLDDNIMKMLADYYEYYKVEALKYGTKWHIGPKAVFSAPLKPGECIGPTTVRSWLKTFLKKNGLPHINPHKFRHTSISLQLQAGISVPDAAKRAGHARPDVTMNLSNGYTLKTTQKRRFYHKKRLPHNGTEAVLL